MKTDIDSIPNLYSITNNVLDINTVLINREELRKLIEAKKDLLEALDKAICDGGMFPEVWQQTKTFQSARICLKVLNTAL